MTCGAQKEGLQIGISTTDRLKDWLPLTTPRLSRSFGFAASVCLQQGETDPDQKGHTFRQVCNLIPKIQTIYEQTFLLTSDQIQIITLNSVQDRVHENKEDTQVQKNA